MQSVYAGIQVASHSIMNDADDEDDEDDGTDATDDADGDDDAGGHDNSGGNEDDEDIHDDDMLGRFRMWLASGGVAVWSSWTMTSLLPLL